VGSRGGGRAKTETPVPVDVIRINQVGLPTAKMDLTSVLNIAAPSFNYNKYADVINDVKSISKTTGVGLSFGASKSKEKKYDVSLQNEFNFNKSTTSQNTNNTHYNTNSLSVSATVYYKKVWSVITDYQYNTRQKIFEADKNLNNQLLNARIQRTFKADEYTIYFTVRDILNQNIGINRSFYSNIYTEERNSD